MRITLCGLTLLLGLTPIARVNPSADYPIRVNPNSENPNSENPNRVNPHSDDPYGLDLIGLTPRPARSARGPSEPEDQNPNPKMKDGRGEGRVCTQHHVHGNKSLDSVSLDSGCRF